MVLVTIYESKTAVFTKVMWRIVEGEGEQEGESEEKTGVCVIMILWCTQMVRV